MSVYKQPREGMPVRIYTPEYRIYATLHLVPGRSTADLFNLEQREFIPITDAQLFSPGWSHPPREQDFRGRVPFLGLRRTTVLWVIGGRPQEVKKGTTREVRVGLILAGYLLVGLANIPAAQRVSDHLYTAKGFISMSRAQLFPLAADRPLAQAQPVDSYDFVTVNLPLVSAVAEI